MKKIDSLKIRKPKILLADDDQILRSEFKECFDEYDIIDAMNGDEAARILSGPNDLDLVILDLRMPGLNGLEVLKRVKQDSRRLPVIIFTGFGTKDTVIEALRLEAEDFIEKPFDVDETRKVIEKTLSRYKREPSVDSLDLKGKMEKAKRYLERNYMKKAGLNDAAAVIAISPKYLSRAFKSVFKIGFNGYRQALRIDEAKRLLAGTGYSVDQISYKLGYENSESFIRQFKKHLGKTPSEYRRGTRR